MAALQIQFTKFTHSVEIVQYRGDRETAIAATVAALVGYVLPAGTAAMLFDETLEAGGSEQAQLSSNTATR